jgi:glutathione S-transferase
MRLIGRYASPFVRRTAVTMQYLGIPYQHESLMPFGPGKDVVRAFNPLGRVPVLIPDGESPIIDSAVILDYLDEVVGPNRALVPPSGEARKQVLSRLSVAGGTMDKLVSVLYERHFRPKEKWHRPWIEACDRQVADGFIWLDRQFDGDWQVGPSMTQADITLSVFWSFASGKRPGFVERLNCPNIDRLTERLEATAAFRAAMPEAEKLTNNLRAEPTE